VKAYVDLEGYRKLVREKRVVFEGLVKEVGEKQGD
jgi:hypothetical protein